MAGGAAARHARHHALRRDPPDAVVAAVGHEEHAVRVEHQPARVRERRLDALAVGVAARARPGEHAQAVAVEDADAVVAGVGDVHAPRRRDGEPARVEQRDATTLGCVFVDGLGRRRRRAVEDGDVVRAVHPEGAAGGGRPCERGCWCVWAKWERVASRWEAFSSGSLSTLAASKPKRCERVAGIPAEGRNADAANTASGATRESVPARAWPCAAAVAEPSLHSASSRRSSPASRRLTASFGVPKQGVARRRG